MLAIICAVLRVMNFIHVIFIGLVKFVHFCIRTPTLTSLRFCNYSNLFGYNGNGIADCPLQVDAKCMDSNPYLCLQIITPDFIVSPEINIFCNVKMLGDEVLH